MNSTNRKFLIIAQNIAILGLMFAGLNLGIDGPKYVMFFITGVFGLMALGMFNEEYATIIKNAGRILPQSVNIVIDLIVVFWFVWFGHWFVGAVWLFTLFMYESTFVRPIGNDKNVSKRINLQ